MKLREIYSNVKVILGKDDGFIAMDQLNILIQSIQLELLRTKCEELFTITDLGQAIPKSTYSSKAIQKLITQLTIPNDTIALPSNYLYWIGSSHQTNNGIMRNMEIVTISEYYKRLSNLLSPPIVENPIMYISNNNIYIQPTSYGGDTVNGFLNYIRKPATPFLDYYMDADYKLTFMEASTLYTMSGGMEYRNGTTSGQKTSLTTELELPDDFHPEFQDLLIEKISVSLDDQAKTQYSMIKQQQENAK